MSPSVNSDDVSPVTVVIPCRTERRWTTLVQAVESAKAQNPAPAEIVVVADHNARLFDKIKHELDGVTVLTNRFRRGAAGARNTGAFHAITPLVAFLDDDVRAHQGWLAGLLAPFADPAVTGTGGAILPAWSGSRPAWFPDEYLWTVGASHAPAPSEATPAPEVWSASMAVRRETFVRVGGFPEPVGRSTDRPQTPEDALFPRMSEGGGHLMFVPDARIHHPVGPERMTFRYFLHRCFVAGQTGAISGRGHLQRAAPGALLRNLRAGSLPRTWAVVAGMTANAMGGVVQLTTRPPAPRAQPVQNQKKIAAGVRR
ncbi:glycosyltransferase [Catenuloplanes sp. NPDC051500]|uniref:glycosyltransferase n=1 Tax=Catenuloplanes sp. NPDC051500 TaxID=3363959 RepID=UPI0037892E70